MVMLGFCFIPKSSKEAFSIADASFSCRAAISLETILRMPASAEADLFRRTNCAYSLLVSSQEVGRYAGGNPPALGGRPFREDQLIYSTIQGVYSRCYHARTHVLKHLVNRKSGECCGC